MTIEAALAKRCAPPEWALFFELRNDAGFRASRSADAVAMNTWPSRGLSVHGFEFKRDRRDWLRELKDPAKSAAVQRFCDHWWVVVDGERVIEPGEIPETWGLLALRGQKLIEQKAAPKLTAEPMTRGFIAMLLRNAKNGTVDRSEVNSMIEKRVAAEKQRMVTPSERREESAARELARLQSRIAQFEEQTGIDISAKFDSGDMADPKLLGAAVRVLLSGGTGNRWGAADLANVRLRLEHVLNGLKDGQKILESFKPPRPIEPQADKGAA